MAYSKQVDSTDVNDPSMGEDAALPARKSQEGLPLSRVMIVAVFESDSS